MGLTNWLHNKHMSDPVEGQLQLTACSAGVAGALYSNCEMQGVVTAPGFHPTAVEHLCLAPTRKWPEPGQTLPVRVDRADPTRLEVLWDSMPTNRELGQHQAQQEAQALAAQMPAAQDWAGQQSPDGMEPPAAPGQAPVTSAFAPGSAPPALQALLNDMTRAAGASGAAVPYSAIAGVAGDPARLAPGLAGGGLTPEQAAAAVSGRAPDMQSATARVLAVHDVPLPPGMPGAPPAGLVDLTLDVTLNTGSGYSATMRIGFGTPQTRAKIATVGATLPVLVNPAQRDQVAVDTSHLP
jgi:hypothetical protein